MKLILTALCASFMVLPAFADCDKCEKDDKKKEGTYAEKCDKECDKEKKEEGTLAEKCDKECDKEKKEEGTLA